MAPFTPMLRVPTLFETVKFKFLKSITLAVFFCLPRKLTNVFVSLSIVTMILKLRDRNLLSEQTLLTRIEQLLKIHLSESILVLPDQTVSWFWTHQVLATEVQVDGGKHTLQELLFDSEAFMRHRHLVLNTLLTKLPLSVQYKLKLSSAENRIAVKHNIVSALMYA
jgi:hypothetical protein